MNQNSSANRALSTLAWAIPLALACGGRTLAMAYGEGALESGPNAMVQLRFAARLEFPTTGDAKPQGLLAADLDGDGRDELAAITSSPGSLQIWGGLTRTVQQAIEPRAFAIDDFALGPVWLGGAKPLGSDPLARVAFASRTLPGITVVDLRAAWTTKPGDPLATLWHVDLERRPRVIASGDLGRDGKPEVAVITIDDDLLLVRGPGDMVKTRLADEQATCARFGADGKSVFIGFQGSRRLVRYEIDGGGRAIEKSAVSLDGLPRAIDESGAASDGTMLLVVAGGDERIWTFSVADGKLVPGRTLPTSTIPIALAHGNADGAGGDEWVSIGLQGQQAVVSALAPGAATEMSRTYAGQHPYALAMGDFDGDKMLDLAVSNGDAKRVSVLFGDGKGGFDVASRSDAGRAPHSLAAGDLDGDGKLDVVALSALEGTISVLANKGGRLADRELQGQAQSGDAVRCVDLDGDGHVDAAFLRRTDKGSVLTATFGDGKGRLWQRAEVAPIDVGTSSGDLLVTDLDGDGVLEAIVADPEGGKVALVPIRRVKGAGVAFGTARAIEVPSGPRALASIDAQGDLRPEIAVALGGPGKRLGVALLRGVKDASGSPALEEFQLIPLPMAAIGLAAADFDGDGVADLAVLTSKSESECAVRVLYQSKEHTWSLDAPPLPTGLRPYALRAGDIDGDGATDLVCSAQNSHQVNLWLNGGGKPVNFVRTADLGAGTGPLDVLLADLDGDGRLEILVANAFSNDVSVIRTR